MYKTLHKKQGSVTVQLRFARSSVTFCAKRDRVIPSFAETETTGERYIEIQTLQCNKKVLRNQTKSDTLLKAQLKTCSIWKKGGLVQKNERPSGKWGENPPQLPLL